MLVQTGAIKYRKKIKIMCKFQVWHDIYPNGQEGQQQRNLYYFYLLFRNLHKVEAIMALADFFWGENLWAQWSTAANRGAGEDGRHKNNSRAPSFATNSSIVHKLKFYDGPLQLSYLFSASQLPTLVPSLSLLHYHIRSLKYFDTNTPIFIFLYDSHGDEYHKMYVTPKSTCATTTANACSTSLWGRRSSF